MTYPRSLLDGSQPRPNSSCHVEEVHDHPRPSHHDAEKMGAHVVRYEFVSFDIDDFYGPRIRVGKCYHEAAHAVFAHQAGLQIHDVYVTPAGEGTCDLGLPDDPNPLFAPELATVLLAGEYAEYRSWGASKAGTFEAFEQQVQDDPEFFDLPRARKLLERAATAPDNLWGDLKECHRVASEATASNIILWWPKIEAVAQRLQQGDRLNGEGVSRILEGLR